MVGSPHIDEKVVATRELVAVIRDIGEQVGELAVALDEHAIFVIAVIGGAKPDGSAFVIDNATFTKISQRHIDDTRRNHRLLTEPIIEFDIHPTESEPMIGDRSVFAPLKHVGIGGHFGSPLNDVLALVTTFGQRRSVTSCDQRCNKQLHLRSAIVEVVLAVNVEAASLKNPSE